MIPTRSPRIPLAILLASLAFTAGCHRHKHARGAEAVAGEAAPPAEEAAPPVDNRSAGQIFVDILAQSNYPCNVDTDNRWVCTNPNDAAWPFYVSEVDQPDQTLIMFDSYYLRAFGKRCDQFTNHMADLAVTADGFAVTCDDSSQQFRMDTMLQYQGGLDVTAWVQNHFGHRTASLDLLAKAHATPEVRGRSRIRGRLFL